MPSTLSYYGQFLGRQKRPFDCPDCDASVSPGDFERHCSSLHGLDPKVCCVWCGGSVGWPVREKRLNSTHLLDCSKRFLAERSRRGAVSSRYRSLVERRSGIPFPCPLCETVLAARDFEKHCSSRHGLNPRLCCVWCSGRERWPAGEKNRRQDHLIGCFRKFAISVGNPPPVSRSLRFRAFDLRRICDGRLFFHHEDISATLIPEAFGPIEVLDLPSLDLFDHEDLNVAAAFVRHYAATGAESDWIHVMVKAVAIESFVEAVRSQTGGKVNTLPFSCWCDGGPHAEARFRQHRHMIVVSSPPGHFKKNVWSKVEASETPSAKRFYQCRGSQVVKSALHLVNTMGYLCKRKSRCDFKIDGKKGAATDRHFYIFRTLPVDYMLPLCVQWDGGVLDMLYQTKFKNVSAFKLIGKHRSLVAEEGKWKQRIGDFYGFQSGWVLPVRRTYSPAGTGREDEVPGNRHVHLTGGRRLHFESREENRLLDDGAWSRMQAEGGNFFLDAVADEFWTPRPRDQEKLNLVMPYLHRNVELQSENESLKTEIGTLKTEIVNLKRKHVEEVEDLKKTHVEQIKKLKGIKKFNKIQYEKEKITIE